MIPHDSYWDPPSPEVYDCGCGHSNEQHDAGLGWGEGPCQVEGCECEECDLLDDLVRAHESEDADRRLAEMKEGVSGEDQ